MHTITLLRSNPTDGKKDKIDRWLVNTVVFTLKLLSPKNKEPQNVWRGQNSEDVFYKYQISYCFINICYWSKSETDKIFKVIQYGHLQLSSPTGQTYKI